MQRESQILVDTLRMSTNFWNAVSQMLFERKTKYTSTLYLYIIPYTQDVMERTAIIICYIAILIIHIFDYSLLRAENL